jgi:chemotaxis protein MotB
MARRKDGGHGGGHGWFVTFADLMGLLVAFFVMLVAFSTQDQQKLQIVAGSMREAFGVQDKVRYAGIIEVPGLPTRPKLKNAAHISPEEASATPTPDNHDRNRTYGGRFQDDRAFALASASLRQALQDMPQLTELSKHIMIEEARQGLNIEIVDQDGRSMFPEGSKEPFERTRRLIQRIAATLKPLPFRISITGHTSASKIPPRAGYGPWRQILQEEGVPTAHFFMVAGKADTQPLFPDDPYIAANRRVTITLMREEPPVPPNFKP